MDTLKESAEEKEARAAAEAIGTAAIKASEATVNAAVDAFNDAKATYNAALAVHAKAVKAAHAGVHAAFLNFYDSTHAAPRKA